MTTHHYRLDTNLCPLPGTQRTWQHRWIASVRQSVSLVCDNDLCKFHCSVRAIELAAVHRMVCHLRLFDPIRQQISFYSPNFHSVSLVTAASKSVQLELKYQVKLVSESVTKFSKRSFNLWNFYYVIIRRLFPDTKLPSHYFRFWPHNLDIFRLWPLWYLELRHRPLCWCRVLPIEQSICTAKRIRNLVDALTVWNGEAVEMPHLQCEFNAMSSSQDMSRRDQCATTFPIQFIQIVCVADQRHPRPSAWNNWQWNERLVVSNNKHINFDRITFFGWLASNDTGQCGAWVATAFLWRQ